MQRLFRQMTVSKLSLQVNGANEADSIKSKMTKNLTAADSSITVTCWTQQMFTITGRNCKPYSPFSAVMTFTAHSTMKEMIYHFCAGCNLLNVVISCLLFKYPILSNQYFVYIH